MRLRAYQTWKLQYLFVSPEQWARDHETHFWLKQYEVLDVHAATLVLKDVAQRDPAFLAAIVGQSFGARGFDKQRTLHDLLQGLGRQRLGEKALPRFAWLYVARRKRERAAAPLIDPWKEVREAVQAAERAPRGYVAVEAVSEAGAPVSNLRLELLLADGQVRSAYTDHEGSARAEPIPQGQCHIRVVEVDGSYWHAENGPASQRVDRGRKRSHVVEQGECLTRIAHRHGIKDWKKVWNAPENEALRKKRKNPNVLFPGDEITVPGIDIHEIIVPTDQTHRLIVSKSAELSLEVLLHSVRDEPFADAPYVARYAQGSKTVEVEGQLDGEGRLTMMVPMDVRTMEVELIDLEETFHLTLGQLDPCIDAATKEPIVSGIQQRLFALGYGQLTTGELDDPTREALATFQRTELGRSKPTGEPDAETCAELEKAYGV